MALGAFVAWDQSHWWRTKEDYSFGWLAPWFVAFVIFDRWSQITATAAECSDVNFSGRRGTVNFFQNAAAAVVLLVGAGAFLLGALYRAGAGSSQPGTFAITAGAIVMVLPLIFLAAPTPPVSGDSSAHVRGIARLRLVALFIFPVFVWLISAPMGAAVEAEFSPFLQRKVVTVVSFVFEVLGVPILQQGNVLVLPTGRVGVEEACSGIRSLTGCLFAGSFLAAVFLETFPRKLALVSAALVLAFLANLARGLFLTGWAYRHGPQSIEGTVHDVAGYAVLGLTTVGLLCLLPIFRARISAGTPHRRSPVDTRPSETNAKP